MATVEKDINETSEKIDEVKRIVQERALALEYKKQIRSLLFVDQIAFSWQDQGLAIQYHLRVSETECALSSAG